MKTQRQFGFIILLALSGLVLTASGCSKDKEDARDKFLGAYTVVETCGSGNDSYEITIIASGSDGNAVNVFNLYDSGLSMSATVNGNNITIPSQVFSGATVSGSGSLSGNIVTINFTISFPLVGNDNCVAICTRK